MALGGVAAFGAQTAITEGVGHYKSQLAWRRAKRAMKNRHQWEVGDLKAAGLNPILSAGAAPSIAGPPSPMAFQGGDLAEAIRKSMDSKSQRKTNRMTRQQIAGARDLLKSQYDLMVEQAGTERSKQDMYAATAENTRAQTQRYGPISELGGAASAAMGDLKGGVSNARQNIMNMIGGNAQGAAQMRRLAVERKAQLQRDMDELQKLLDGWQSSAPGRSGQKSHIKRKE